MSTKSSSGAPRKRPRACRKSGSTGRVSPLQPSGTSALRRRGEERQRGGAGQDGGAAGPASVGDRGESERLTGVVTCTRVSPILAGMPHPLTTAIITVTEVSGSETDALLTCSSDEDLCTWVLERTGNQPARHGLGLGRRQAVRPAGTDPHRTRRPVAAAPAHRPGRQARRGRRAARPGQPRDHRRPDGRRAQPDRGPGRTRRVQRAATMGSLLKSIVTGVVFTVIALDGPLRARLRHRARSSPAPASSASRSASAPRRWSRTSCPASS